MPVVTPTQQQQIPESLVSGGGTLSGGHLCNYPAHKSLVWCGAITWIPGSVMGWTATFSCCMDVGHDALWLQFIGDHPTHAGSCPPSMRTSGTQPCLISLSWDVPAAAELAPNTPTSPLNPAEMPGLCIIKVV